MTIAQALLAELEQESQVTRRVLERVPQAHLAWKPHPKARYHHRGQLLVYLRLLDIPVPSVYGPTADESPFVA